MSLNTSYDPYNHYYSKAQVVPTYHQNGMPVNTFGGMHYVIRPHIAKHQRRSGAVKGGILGYDAYTHVNPFTGHRYISRSVISKWE